MQLLNCACVAVLSACANSGASGSDFLGYAGHLTYGGDTARQSGQLVGAYARLADAQGRSLEADCESTLIRMTQGEDLHQRDLTVLAGMRPLRASHLRIGYHHAWDPGQATPLGRSAIVHVSQRGLSDYWGTLLMTASRFNVSTPALTAYQASPRLGVGWWWGAQVDASIGVTLIRFDQDPGFGNNRCVSADTALCARFRHVRVVAAAWVGQRSYHLAESGIVVYDLPALFRHGVSVDIAVDMWRASWLEIQAGSESFQQYGVHDNAQARRVVVMVGITF